MKVFQIFIILVFLFPSFVFADFDSGKQAFDAGDFRTAFSEWKTSADQGDAESQYELGKLYEEGLGVPQNFVFAHVYFNLAASSGHKEARTARNTISKNMTNEELAEARSLAQRWQPVQENPQMAQPAPQPVPVPQASPPPPTPPAIDNTQEGLFKASRDGNVDAVKQILASGVDVNVRDSKGRTALMIAAFHGHKQVVETLIQAKAEIYAKSKKGVTAQVLAEKKGFDEITKILNLPVLQEMVLIPAGKFYMGEEDQFFTEITNPIKTIYLEKFFIDKYEVTYEVFNKVMGKNWPAPERKNLPTNSNFVEAKEYCRRVGKRLPTDAEWEKAARGGTTSKFYWGNEMESGKANFCDQNCNSFLRHMFLRGASDSDIKSMDLDDGHKDAAPVGSYPPNPYGLYDIAGNKQEWVSSKNIRDGTFGLKASYSRHARITSGNLGLAGIRCAKDAP
jgi:sulfatase-modifying factor enzyme 1/ankyrin repeat protein/Sel1 repeat-containing protein